MNNDTLSSIFWTVALGQIKRVITCAYNWRMREKCSTSRWNGYHRERQWLGSWRVLWYYKTCRPTEERSPGNSPSSCINTLHHALATTKKQHKKIKDKSDKKNNKKKQQNLSSKLTNRIVWGIAVDNSAKSPTFSTLEHDRISLQTFTASYGHGFLLKIAYFPWDFRHDSTSYAMRNDVQPFWTFDGKPSPLSVNVSSCHPPI